MSTWAITPVNATWSGGLPYGADHHFVDVHVRWLLEGVDDRPGDVVRLQRTVADRVVEERRVDHAGLDQRDLDVGVRDLGPQRVAHRGHRPLGGRVERAGQ